MIFLDMTIGFILSALLCRWQRKKLIDPWYDRWYVRCFYYGLITFYIILAIACFAIWATGREEEIYVFIQDFLSIFKEFCKENMKWE